MAIPQLIHVLAAFADEIDRQPTLGEFLEILGNAVPTRSDALAEGVELPVLFSATLLGNRRYASQARSSVSDLNDAAFAEASEFLAHLADQAAEATGGPVSMAVLASCVRLVLNASEAVFEDVNGADVRSLRAPTQRRRAKVTIGDVLAIPAKSGGYHLAVVVARNDWGTALGVFDGTAALPTLRADAHPARDARPDYTDEQLIHKGVWRVVGHDEALIGLFREPVIYHRVYPDRPNPRLGEFGAAESPDGTLRRVDEQEARDVGLLDMSYRQGHLCENLHWVLDEQA